MTDRASIPPAHHYSLVPTPAGTFSHHAVDMLGRLHQGLTVSAQFLHDHFAASTARKYLGLQRRWAAWLDISRPGTPLPSELPRLLAEYLREAYGCKLRSHGLEAWRARSGEHSAATIRSVVAAVVAYYDAHVEYGVILGKNPLRQARMVLYHQGCKSIAVAPACIIVSAGKWVPHFTFNPDLRQVMTEGAEEDRWPGWARCILAGLFDSGGRIHELCSLMLRDWLASNCRGGVQACSKGSRGRRVKVLALHPDTVDQWRQYFDGERRDYDPRAWRLTDYRTAVRARSCEPSSVPIFLTRRGNAPPPGTFRDLYWRPTAERKGIPGGPHTARHWYVTMRMSRIIEETKTGEEFSRAVSQLIGYMNWVNGHEMLDHYDHTVGFKAAQAFLENPRPVDGPALDRGADYIRASKPLQQLLGEPGD